MKSPHNESQGDLYAFVSHAGTVFGRGSAHEAQVLVGIMNAHRALDRYYIQPADIAETGVDEIFSIKSEIERSYAAMNTKGTLDRYDHLARPVSADKDRIQRFDTK